LKLTWGSFNPRTPRARLWAGPKPVAGVTLQSCKEPMSGTVQRCRVWNAHTSRVNIPGVKHVAATSSVRFYFGWNRRYIMKPSFQYSHIPWKWPARREVCGQWPNSGLAAKENYRAAAPCRPFRVLLCPAIRKGIGSSNSRRDST
jgi:hypothetical protein